MKIGLIDSDSHNFTNLAIMKIAGFHKKIGDYVEWYTPFDSYDIVYISKVFTFTEGYWQIITNADEIRKGGTGFDLKTTLPKSIEYCTPDYGIYRNIPKNTAYGFLTRGCVNKCSWCVVPEKEGYIRPYMDVEDIAIDGRKNLILLDNNILAAGDYAKIQLEKIIRNGYRVDFNQALDARLVDSDNAQLLAQIKWLNSIRFGCDTQSQIVQVERALDLLEKYGFKGNILLYTMLNESLAECYMRLKHWKLYHHNKRIRCHAQPYIDYGKNTLNIPQWQKDMARWANRKEIYATVDFMDYKPRKGFTCNKYFE